MGVELAPLNPDCRVVPTSALRSNNTGHVFFNDSASAYLRLSPAGALAVSGWFAGKPIGSAANHHKLARRFEAIGLATIVWPAASRLPGCDAVIPVYNDLSGLQRTLRCLDASGLTGIVVVDDGSTWPIDAGQLPHLADIALQVIRRGVPGGPSVARQLGLEYTKSPLVAFIDAGVTVDSPTLTGLRTAMADPSTLAVAPRVRSIPGPGVLARYDAHRSPLDLGTSSSLVGPGQPITYVPSACLVTRRDSVAAVGGFDPALRYGEDVDLVWRLLGHGLVRYLPSFVAWHPPRSTVAGFVAQRVGYHSAATALAQRHGYQMLAPCRFSWWTVATFTPLLIGQPWVTVAALAAHSAQVKRQLPPDVPGPWVRASRAAVRGNAQLGLSVASAAARAWFPLLAPLWMRSHALRRPIQRLLGIAIARRLLDSPSGKTFVTRILDVGWGAVDDLASCAGLWVGGLRHRAIPPIKPMLVRVGGRPRSTGQ